MIDLPTYEYGQPFFGMGILGGYRTKPLFEWLNDRNSFLVERGGHFVGEASFRGGLFFVGDSGKEYNWDQFVIPMHDTVHCAIVVHSEGAPDSEFGHLDPVQTPFDRYTQEDLPKFEIIEVSHEILQESEQTSGDTGR